MAKKSKPKFQLRKLHHNKHVRRHFPLGLVVLALLGAYLLGKAQPVPTHPKSLVWAASEEVKVPIDLITFLEGTTNCVDTPGVSLWSVVKVSQGKFAKLAYGCSYDLNFYEMAVKQAGKWQILDTKTYFANNFLPKCEVVETYQLDNSIEPFCLDSNGGSRENRISVK